MPFPRSTREETSVRLPYYQFSKDLIGRYLEVSNELKKSSLGTSLLNLVYLRASQLNGCPYCVDLHYEDALKEGESGKRLNAIVVWRDTPFFSERERAALEWTELVTRLP